MINATLIQPKILMPHEANSSNVFILDHLEHLSDLTGPLGDLIGPKETSMDP